MLNFFRRKPKEPTAEDLKWLADLEERRKKEDARLQALYTEPQAALLKRCLHEAGLLGNVHAIIGRPCVVDCKDRKRLVFSGTVSSLNIEDGKLQGVGTTILFYQNYDGRRFQSLLWKKDGGWKIPWSVDKYDYDKMLSCSLTVL